MALELILMYLSMHTTWKLGEVGAFNSRLNFLSPKKKRNKIGFEKLIFLEGQ